MIKLAGIGHVLLLRVADEEASKRFYCDILGFEVAEQDPEHGGVFMTLGDGFHAIDLTQAPEGTAQPERGQRGLVHVAFKVASYAALRDAYTHLLDRGVEILRALDHICQRSVLFPPTPRRQRPSKSITRCPTPRRPLFPNGRGDEDERLPPAAPPRASPCPPGSPKTGPARPSGR